MYTLIIEDRHGKNAAEISFEQGTYTIGRVDGNDVVLPSNSVSRTHARIFVSNNKCYIDDLGSTAGSIINGVPISGRTEITNGTRIKIGEYMLYLEYKDSAAENNQGQEILKTQIVSGAQSGFKIVRVGDKFAGEEFMLTEASNSIGRTEDNYILLSDPSVSRSHASIVNHAMTYKVVDNNSANGTFVNEVRVRGEAMLQNGDEIRFGNLRFVFVPATQRVDLSQYAKHNMADNRFLMLGIGFVVVAIVIIIILGVVLVGNKDNNVADDGNATANQEEALIKLNVDLEDANRLFHEGRFDAADDFTKKIAKTWPKETRVIELQQKIDEELRNEKIIEEGDELFNAREFGQAYDKYSLVSEQSAFYNRAKDRKLDAERKMLVVAYNDARSECAQAVTSECLENMCNAALKLKDTGKSESSISDAKEFMATVVKGKNEFSQQAKKCLQRL